MPYVIPVVPVVPPDRFKAPGLCTHPAARPRSNDGTSSHPEPDPPREGLPTAYLYSPAAKHGAQFRTPMSPPPMGELKRIASAPPSQVALRLKAALSSGGTWARYGREGSCAVDRAHAERPSRTQRQRDRTADEPSGCSFFQRSIFSSTASRTKSPIRLK